MSKLHTSEAKAEKMLKRASAVAKQVLEEATKVAETMRSDRKTGIDVDIGLAKDISYIQKDIAEIKETVKILPGIYVTKAEFEAKFNPIQKGFWGLMAVLGLAVIGALLRLVLIQ